MEKEYYKAYYQLERSHWWFKARGEMLIDHYRQALQGKKDVKILNIGAATGRTSELLSQLGAVESVEYDADCYQFVKDNLSIPIIQGSILALPYPDASFDLVTALDVIEHVEDDRLAVAEMLRVCKPGGFASATVPAFMFLWSSHDLVNHHFRRYTAPQIEKLFAAHPQFQKTYQTYFNTWLFFPIAFFRLIRKAMPEKKTGEAAHASDFESVKNERVNQIFYRIFKSENFFLRRRFRLPVGVSILSTWQKVESG